MMNRAVIVVNFGGPRSLKEIEPFLQTLLTDKEVIPSPFPQWVHNIIFGRVAKKRAQTLVHDYGKLGGASPIWRDTEYVAATLRPQLKGPLLTFHRYLPSTHPAFIENVMDLKCDEILIFPMFPQFAYATTGSVARFFSENLPAAIVKKFRWVRSYPSHPAYVNAMREVIAGFIDQRGLPLEEVFFLFSAHGLPQSFIDKGDPYASECHLSYQAIMDHFPKGKGILCYQSKFGKGEWLKPYTVAVCQHINEYRQGRKYCLFVPLSFTSDHIETLFEVEEQYMPLIKAQGLYPFRVPALNRHPHWISAITDILSDLSPCLNGMLIHS